MLIRSWPEPVAGVRTWRRTEATAASCRVINFPSLDEKGQSASVGVVPDRLRATNTTPS
jgi:hypothetical protein